MFSSRVVYHWDRDRGKLGGHRAIYLAGSALRLSVLTCRFFMVDLLSGKRRVVLRQPNHLVPPTPPDSSRG